MIYTKIMILTAYRIENIIDGEGYFNSQNWNLKQHSNQIQIEHNHRAFPNIFKDIGLKKFINNHYNKKGDYTEYYCAFNTIEDIFKVLSIQDLHELINHDFKIFKLKIRNGYISQKQIVFKKKDIICKSDITSQFKD